jgi:hypothetical protein
MMKENWCDWHVLVVEAVEGDTPTVTVMHPNCPFTVTVAPIVGADFEYACQIQHEINNVSFDSLLETTATTTATRSPVGTGRACVTSLSDTAAASARSMSRSKWCPSTS